MADCFISYAAPDRELAEFIRSKLSAQGVDVFMAPESIAPGEPWSDVIRQKLLSSSWVIFLASAEACRSSYVQQELGMALGASKNVVPVVWDMDPGQLPGWTKKYQALDLRTIDKEQLWARIDEIASKIHQDRVIGLIIAAVLAFALIYILAHWKD